MRAACARATWARRRACAWAWALRQSNSREARQGQEQEREILSQRRGDAEVRGEKIFFFSDLCVSARESSWSYLGELSALDDVRRNHSAHATDDTRKRLAATMARLVAGHLFRTIVTT